MPRPTLYLVSSLLVLQLMSGLGVTIWGVFPTLTECWPWGRLACQVSPGHSSHQTRPNDLWSGWNIKRPFKSAIYISPRPLLWTDNEMCCLLRSRLCSVAPSDRRPRWCWSSLPWSDISPRSTLTSISQSSLPASLSSTS